MSTESEAAVKTYNIHPIIKKKIDENSMIYYDIYIYNICIEMILSSRHSC